MHTRRTPYTQENCVCHSVSLFSNLRPIVQSPNTHSYEAEWQYLYYNRPFGLFTCLPRPWSRSSFYVFVNKETPEIRPLEDLGRENLNQLRRTSYGHFEAGWRWAREGGLTAAAAVPRPGRDAAGVRPIRSVRKQVRR